jgi:hypothetical protein
MAAVLPSMSGTAWCTQYHVPFSTHRAAFVFVDSRTPCGTAFVNSCPQKQPLQMKAPVCIEVPVEVVSAGHSKDAIDATKACVANVQTNDARLESTSLSFPPSNGSTSESLADGEVARYTDGDGDTSVFRVEAGSLIMYVNGEKRAGQHDTTGIVTELWYSSGMPAGIRTQHGWGSGDVPVDVVEKLRQVASKLGLANNLPVASSIPQELEHTYKLPAIEASTSNLPQTIDKDTIQLVSLGCACGPKLAFQELGRGAETLPFDWITTTSDGVLDFLRSGFQGFFEFERKVEKDVGGINITAFRSKQHGFWHDDPTLMETQEKYYRRFGRMLATDARSQPVLFVRLAATSEEIRSVNELLDQLISQFGPHACLLLIIDLQGANAPGPCTVKGLDNLLIHYIDGGSGITKFCDPIDNALDWVACKPVRSAQVQDLEVAWTLAKQVTPGYYGMGGMPAFEGIPEIFL